MNIATAKSISIIELLAALGHEPVRISSDRYCYRSHQKRDRAIVLCEQEKERVV